VSEKTTRRAPSGRTKSRELAMWALYQQQITGMDQRDIYNQFLLDSQGSKLNLDLIADLVSEYIEEMEKASLQDFDARYFSGVDPKYFQELVLKIPPLSGELEQILVPFADRPMNQLDPVERSILLIGAYELRERPDIPYRVVINEAVELAKFYGAEDGHRYVNAILDKASETLRKVERQARQKRS
jgi:N utilization substance protein B